MTEASEQRASNVASFVLAGCLVLFITGCAAGVGAFVTWAVLALSGGN